MLKPLQTPPPPGNTTQTEFSTPLISGVSSGGSQASISWTQSGTAPEGGYDIVINGTIASTQYRTTESSMAIPGLDLSSSQCFAVEGRFTQAEPDILLRSENSCTTPPPVTPLDPATVLYVSPDEAIGSCPSITPDYGSVNSALAAATPGDTVRLLPGIYRSTISFTHGGTLTQPITLTHTPISACTAGGVRSAIIDCSTLGNVNCVTTNHGNAIIDGLEVHGAYVNGIKVDGHVNGTPDASSYGCWGGYCSTEGHYNTNGADNVIIRNNYIHDIGYDGIKIGHVNNVLIENNEIFNTGNTSTQQGVDLVGVYHAVIRNNYIHDEITADNTTQDMLVALFIKGGSENILIENNHIANLHSPQAGIEVGGDTEWYNTRYTPADLTFDANTEIMNNNDYNHNFIHCRGRYVDANCLFENNAMAEARQAVVRGNLIVNTDPALSFRNVYDAKVYNNTTIDAGWGQALYKLWTDGHADHVNAHIKIFNNLSYNSLSTTLTMNIIQDKAAGAPSAPQNMEGFLFTNNLIFDEGNASPQLGINAAFASAAEQFFIQPQLTNDHKLQASSPAIDEGLDPATIGTILGYESTTPFVDRDGTAVPVSTNYDIGAYEYIAP